MGRQRKQQDKTPNPPHLWGVLFREKEPRNQGLISLSIQKKTVSTLYPSLPLREPTQEGHLLVSPAVSESRSYSAKEQQLTLPVRWPGAVTILNTLHHPHNPLREIRWCSTWCRWGNRGPLLRRGAPARCWQPRETDCRFLSKFSLSHKLLLRWVLRKISYVPTWQLIIKSSFVNLNQKANFIYYRFTGAV